MSRSRKDVFILNLEVNFKYCVPGDASEVRIILVLDKSLSTKYFLFLLTFRRTILLGIIIHTYMNLSLGM